MIIADEEIGYVIGGPDVVAEELPTTPPKVDVDDSPMEGGEDIDWWKQEGEL